LTLSRPIFDIMCLRILWGKLFFLVFLYTSSFGAETNGWEALEKELLKLNDAGNYVESLQKIDEYVAKGNRDPFNLYQAYLQKSFTYKRLFDYEEVLLYLEMALKAGLKSNRPAEVEARVKAEKAFAYFDIQEYYQANELMQQLRKTEYQYLSKGVVSYLVMQQGFLEMQQANYPQALFLLQEALSLMKEYSPRNTPMVYGKLLALYGKMGDQRAMKDALKLGLEAAKEYDISKYEIYMYECLRDQFADMKEFKKAYEAYVKVDSLIKKYDATANLNRMKGYEKEYAVLEQQLKLKREKSTINMLIVVLTFSFALAFSLFRLYKSRKHEMQLLEKEYDRIRFDLEQMTRQVNNAQIKKTDLKEMNLSARQLEIIELIKKGYSNKQIGSELFISENTVKYHLKAIYELLQVDNRTELFHLYSSESKSERGEADS